MREAEWVTILAGRNNVKAVVWHRAWAA